MCQIQLTYQNIYCIAMDNYMKFEMIGRGSNGTKVYLVKNLIDNNLYAMKKIFHKEENDSNEVSIMEKLSNHPYIISYVDSFISKSNKLCIITEYFKNGDLASFISKHRSTNTPIYEQLILKWIYQLTTAISYIHSKNIIHNDIKPGNIFITDTFDIKIADFGISFNINDTPKTNIGTPLYLPPELCKGKPPEYKSDMWMIGCVAYELTTLSKPFMGGCIAEIMRNIVTTEPKEITSRSKRLNKIINGLLNKNPIERYSDKDVIKEITKTKGRRCCSIDVKRINNNVYSHKGIKVQNVVKHQSIKQIEFIYEDSYSNVQ